MFHRFLNTTLVFTHWFEEVLKFVYVRLLYCSITDNSIKEYGQPTVSRDFDGILETIFDFAMQMS